MKEISDQHKRFIEEYLIDLNGTQAAIRAGYEANSAHVQASRLLSNDKVRSALAKALQKRSEAVKIDSNYVLKRLGEIDAMDAMDILDDNGNVLPIKKWPKVWRISISGMDVTEIMNGGDASTVLKKIKWPDKTKNLELIGKHVDVQAWGDKKEDNLAKMEDQASAIMDKIAEGLPN